MSPAASLPVSSSHSIFSILTMGGCGEVTADDVIAVDDSEDIIVLDTKSGEEMSGVTTMPADDVGVGGSIPLAGLQ